MTLQEQQEQLHSTGDLSRKELTKGRPFEPALAKQVEALVGFKLSHDGLQKIYTDTVDGCKPFVGDFQRFAQHNMISYEVSWRDHQGHEVASATRFLGNHPDGSLELVRAGAYVAPECRGEGASVKILNREIEFLRVASKHPKTHISIQAGDYAIDGQHEKLGSYTWCRHGFDFPEHYPQDHLPMEFAPRFPDDDGKKSNAEVMRDRFKLWVGQRFPGEQNQKIRGSLEVVADHVEHPWELANLTIPGLKVDEKIGEKTVSCDLGKAFLVSDLSPCWRGTLRVNDPDFKGEPVRSIFCSQQLKEASDRAETKDKKLREQLVTDPVPALAMLKTRGNAEMIPALKMLSLRRPDLFYEVRDTVESIQGGQLQSGLWREINRQGPKDPSAWHSKEWIIREAREAARPSPDLLDKLTSWVSSLFETRSPVFR
jgi:hypothetical protein